VSMLFFYLASLLQLITESFPVSSSGHLALLDKVWSRVSACTSEYQLPAPWIDPYFWERYIDFLHIVPLCIIAWYFYPRWRVFLLHPLRTWRTALKLIGYVVLADGVTGVLYLARARINFCGFPLWIGFSATVLLLLSLLLLPKVKGCGARLTVPRMLMLGLIQGLALVPGLSRFAATFCGARLLGFSSRSSFEVSFMLQWPLILVAVMRSALFFMHHVEAFVVKPLMVATFGLCAVLAWLGFCLSARLVKTERLWLCALYVLVVALVAAFFAY